MLSIKGFKMKTTILYHKNCTDGFISALNFYAYYKELNELDNVTFIPVQYNQGLPDKTYIEGKDVYVLDFSFSKEDTVKLIEMTSSLNMLDHHKAAVDNLFTGERFIENSVVEKDDYAGVYFLHTKTASLMVDKKESGATLAYNEAGKLIANENIRNRLQYLSVHAKDRDLWKFKLKDSLAVYEYCNKFNFDLEQGYKELVCSENKEFSQNIINSQIRVDMRDELANKYAKKHSMIKFMGYVIPVVNVSSDFSSIVGDILNKKHPFALMYSVGFDKIYVSLRSDEQTGVDVNEIAKKLGGGGHVNAAGFSVPVHSLVNLMNGQINEKYYCDVEPEKQPEKIKYKWFSKILYITRYSIFLIILSLVVLYISNKSQEFFKHSLKFTNNPVLQK